MNAPFLRALKSRAKEGVDALYALERRLMIPLPIIGGGVGLVLVVLCLFVALVFRPGSAGLPFRETFEGGGAERWAASGGDWAVRDGALVQRGAADQSQVKMAPLHLDAAQPFQLAVDIRGPEGGLLFNAQRGDSHQQSHVVRLSVENHILYAMYGYFTGGGAFVRQGESPLAPAAAGTDTYRVGVWVDGDHYHVLVNGSVVAVSLPLQHQRGNVGLIASAPLVLFDNLEAERWQPEGASVAVAPTPAPVLVAEVVDVSAVGDLHFSASFGPDETGSSRWQPLTGDWVFEPGALVQQQPDGFDHGVSYADTFEMYALRVTLAHRARAGGGVLFNMPNRNNLRGAHMVRYFQQGNVLAWGYFDETGAYVGQGSAAVPVAGTDSHLIEVRSGPDSYMVSVDGVLVASSVPLVSKRGYIGLTASESVVAFEAVEVYALGERQGAASAVALSADAGEWVSGGGAAAQVSSEPLEFVAGTDIVADTFRVSADVWLPATELVEDAGGGLVFHMRAQHDHALGHMVRFANGGRELVWGLYDAQGAFEQVGEAELNLEEGVPHTLTLTVRSSNYDIEVDGEPVVSRLLVESGDGTSLGGWIGLVAYRGPVVFSDFWLTTDGSP